ncbi:hypothetical protein FQZ97_1124360 [compost metagenome]
MQLSRSIIACRVFASLTRVSTSRLSHTPLTSSCGSRSRNTERMFFANCRIKCLRTGGLLMVISGKTLTISFIKTAHAETAKKQGRGL